MKASRRQQPLITAILITVAGFLSSGCGGGGGGDAAAPPPPPPVVTPPQGLVSQASTFAAGCSPPSGGLLFTNAEVEPHVAINPRDGNHLIGVWQQDRWSDGSAAGNMTGVSFDGGLTWALTRAPVSFCAGGNAQNGGAFQRATDPWVTFAADGTAYQMALSTSGASFSAGSSNAMIVSRSIDGGRTWGNAIPLITDGASHFNDKNTITADPLDARYVYAVWDRLAASGGGPAVFTRTTDGGVTWESPRSIADPGVNSQTIGNVIAVTPAGILINLYTQLDPGPGGSRMASLQIVRSPDKGATWTAPIRVAELLSIGARDPETGTAIRDGSIIPQIAAGPNGHLHVVWQDARFSAGVRDAIAYSRSTDGGLTWSAPVRVNSVDTTQAFIPQVAVRLDGTIGVSYFDLRSNTTDPTTLPAEYWLSRSADGITWTETRVAGPFDYALAPNARGLFLGDYMGLVASGTTFITFFTQTNNNVANRTDVFARRVAAATTEAGTAKHSVLATAAESVVDAEWRDRVSANIEANLLRRRAPALR